MKVQKYQIVKSKMFGTMKIEELNDKSVWMSKLQKDGNFDGSYKFERSIIEEQFN